MHAAFLFSTEFPAVTESWHRESNYVVVLQIPDEVDLFRRFNRCADVLHRVMVFEPDIDDQATAFAVLGADAGRILSDLPLAMKAAAMV